MAIDVSGFTEAWKMNEASGAALGVNGYNWSQSGPTLGSKTGHVEDPASSFLARGDFQPIGGTSNQIYLYDSTAGIGDVWDIRGASSFTLAGWIKLYSSMDAGYWCASLYEISAANKQAFRFAPYSSDGVARNPIFRMFDGLSAFNEKTVRATTGVAIAKDVWQFVAYGYNATTNKIFCFWGRDVGEHYYNTEDGFAAGFGYSVTTGAHHSRYMDGAGQGINQKNDADQFILYNGLALTEEELEFLWNDHDGRALDDLVGPSTVLLIPDQIYEASKDQVDNMRFRRPQIIEHRGTGSYQHGEETTTAIEVQSELNDLVLGNGVASKTITDADGVTQRSVLTETLPITAASTWAAYQFDIYDNQQIFANIHIVNFGAGGMTALLAAIEFQDPDYPEMWIPSLEGIARSVGTRAGNTLTMNAIGNYVMASRQEHRHFRKVRFLFQADAAVDADTEIWVTWSHDGAPSRVTEVTNEDFANVWD